MKENSNISNMQAFFDNNNWRKWAECIDVYHLYTLFYHLRFYFFFKYVKN